MIFFSFILSSVYAMRKKNGTKHIIVVPGHMPLQEPECQIQMALHRTLRYPGLLRNFFSRQPFYIGKDENFTTLCGQVFQQFIQMAVEIFNGKLFYNWIVAFQQVLIIFQIFLVSMRMVFFNREVFLEIVQATGISGLKR